jgi:hypothetical protein
MEMKFRYRGVTISAADIAYLRYLISENPQASRRALSRIVCEAWNWRQQNGALRDMVCRSLMLELHRAGHIALPPVRRVNPNPLARRRRPKYVPVDQAPIEGSLYEIQPVEFRQVRRTKDEPLFAGLIEKFHYLGYIQPVGEHLKYIVYAHRRPIACFAWSSAPRHLGPRDRFIGWSKEARRRNIRFLAYNTRFLIMPWVRVPQLASHLLGRMAKEISRGWEEVYGHPIWYLESFVDPERFPGTCYRAANWHFLGLTTGRGKDDQRGKPNRSLKEILGYPLTRRFRQLLSGERKK